MGIYREWIKAVKGKKWDDLQGFSLEKGKWNFLVLAKLDSNNKLQDVLLKVVRVLGGNEQIPPINDLVEVPFPTNNPNVKLFDPFGAAVLMYQNNQNNQNNSYESVLLGKLGILPGGKFPQTYGWFVDEKRWDLVGSLPYVPPVEAGGICWGGKYLPDYHLSAVKFPYSPNSPDSLESILMVTMRVGVVLRLKKSGNSFVWEMKDRRNNRVVMRIEIKIDGDKMALGIDRNWQTLRLPQQQQQQQSLRIDVGRNEQQVSYLFFHFKY